MFQGNENLALNLSIVLQMAEPLEERTVQDHAGALIAIAYTYYVLRDCAAALQIARGASIRFSDDAQLQRIVQMLP